MQKISLSIIIGLRLGFKRIRHLNNSEEELSTVVSILSSLGRGTPKCSGFVFAMTFSCCVLYTEYLILNLILS